MDSTARFNDLNCKISLPPTISQNKDQGGSIAGRDFSRSTSLQMISFKPFIPVSSASNALQKISLNLSMSEEVKPLIHAMNEHIDKSSANIFDFLHQFSNNEEQVTNSLNSLISQFTKEIQSGHVSPKRQAQVDAIMDMAMDEIQFYASSAQQILAIQQRGTQMIHSEVQKSMELIFHARKLEMDHIKDKLLILRDQENYELTNFLKLHTQKLKEEVEHFNRILHIEKLQYAQEKKMSENEKKKQDLAEKQANELKNLEIYAQEEYNKYQEQLNVLKFEAKGFNYTLDSVTRCKLATALLSAQY